MAEFCFHSTLYLLFLIKFLSLLLLLSSPSSAAANFLINCGGPNVSLSDDWTFLADDTSSSSFSVKGGESIENSSILPSDTSPLYQTARIFHQPSYFELNIADIGNYLVRLHFFTFKSKKTDFSNAFFNVSGSNFTLLSNYSTENTAHLPVKKEFFLFINEGKFKIHFIPANKKSFAFINAIEVLHLPEDFLFDKNSNLNSIYPVPPLSGTLFKYTALNTLYRINVGGQKVNDADDLLRREWLTDDPYLIGGNISVRNHRYDGKLNQFPNATQIQDIAPDIVYKTCSYETTDNNITWRFDVRKEIMHLVRLHFCDIVSEVAGTLFDLYIYTKYRNVVDPYNDLKTTTMAAPFFSDYVVKSDDSGHIDISVGINDASENKFAYLNGVEIMEFVTDKIK